MMSLSVLKERLPVSLLVFAVPLGLGACGGGGPAGEEPNRADDRRIEIARAVYGLSDEFPTGFYRETDPYPDRQTLTVHVRESEVRSLSLAVNYESCTDDFSEALDWSASNAEARGLDTTLNGNSETDWYFQFDRTINSVEPAVLINRVFKCEQIDRSVLSEERLGRLNKQPANASDLRWVAEYLWGFSEYNNAFHAVLDSRSLSESPASHRIVRAQALRFAAADNCDLIEVWEHDYELDDASGLVLRSMEFREAFAARLQAGIASLCSSNG